MKSSIFVYSVLACLVLLMSVAIAVNISSSSKAQVMAGTSDYSDDKDYQWLLDLIEDFIYALPLPDNVIDVIEDTLCKIDDGFSFCEE